MFKPPSSAIQPGIRAAITHAVRPVTALLRKPAKPVPVTGVSWDAHASWDGAVKWK